MIVKIKQLLIPLAIFIISLIIIYDIIPAYHPFGGLKIVNDKESILNKSKEYLIKAKIAFDEKKLDVDFETDKIFVKWITSEYKLNEANKIISESAAAYYWTVSLDKNDDSVITVSANSDGNVNLGKPVVKLIILDNGKIIEFNHYLTDSVMIKALAPQEAKELAQDFIKKLRPDIIFLDDSLQSQSDVNLNTYFYKETETINKPDRVDYNFAWQTKTDSEINYLLKAQVIGNQLSNFNIQVILPYTYKKTETDVFEIVTTILFTLLIIISVLIVGFKRFRAYEVGFKHAIAFRLFVLISFIVKELHERLSSFEFTLILGLGLGGILIAGIAVVLWAVSETIFREIWNKKFLSLDLIYHRKFIHSLVGKTIVNSISFGLGLTAIFFVLLLL